MTLPEAKAELEKFVKLKTTLQPAFVDVLLNADLVEVRHGRWIHKDPSGTSCSKCGSLFPMFMGLYDYCPNCGASMDEVTE